MKWIKTSEQVPDRPDDVWIIVMDEDGKKVIYPNYSYDDLYRYAYPPIESPRKIFHYSYEDSVILRRMRFFIGYMNLISPCRMIIASI